MLISTRCTTSLVMLMMTILPATGSSLLTVLPAQAQAQDTRKAAADRLLNQGREQFQTSQFEAALQSWQQALNLYRAIKDRQGEGWASGNLGSASQSLGNYPKAIEYAQQWLAIAREIKDRQSEAKALSNLGLAYDSLGNYPKAIDYAQQWLAIAREIKDRQSEGAALGNLGNAYDSLGNYPKAIEYHQQNLAIAREIKDRQSEGAALGNLGNAYQSLGNYPKAIDYAQQWLTIAREIKDRQSQGAALGNLGNAYNSLGNYPKAIEYQQQGLTIAREIKDRQSEGNALNNLGNAYQSLGNYPKAIEYQQQALVIDREIKNRQSEAKALGNLGNSYYSLGNYPKAIDYQQQDLAIAREIKDRQSEAKALGNLGNAYYSLGNYPKAIDYAQQWLAIAREIKDRQSEGTALGSLGNAYQSLGNYPKAIEYQQQGLTIAREIKDRQSEGTALGNLGNAYYSLGNYPKAINYAQQWLTIAREIKDRQSEGTALGSLGNAYQSLGNYPKAIEYQQQGLTIAREIKDRQSEGSALNNLGNAYQSLGNYPKAIEYQQQYLAIAREIKDRQSEWIALNNLGNAFYQSGQAAAAAQPLSGAITVLESLRTGLPEADQLSLLETQRNPYLILQQVQVALHKPTAALETAERGRARVFAEQLCQRFATTPTDAGCSSLPPITLAQIQQVAREQKATLVEYAIIPYDKPSLYIWVVQPSGEVRFQSTPLTILETELRSGTSGKPDDRGGSGTKIAEVIRGTLDSLGAKGRSTAPSPPVDPAAETKQLKALYQQLIAPIAAQLPKDPEQPVIFIPQGPFFQVPFAALQDPQGRSLIEQHTLLSAPSIQALALISQQQTRKKAPGVRSALIIGNPAITSVVLVPGKEPQPLPDLPGSRQEAQQIATLFKTQPILGKDANKAAVMGRMGQANVIHLATHGFLDDVKGVGVPGAIALSPTINPPDNGLLTADEILTQKLTADLVVLSACDTGRGTITGDGVIGLSRALLYAGAPDVVVSLWKVPDAPTAALMQEFYRQWLRNPEQGKARALRQAMLNTRKTYPAPLSWAAFTLIGVAK
ncbi:MAG: tetratricopeptide repeat protein [Leptolyngbya sp. BL-A-14]